MVCAKKSQEESGHLQEAALKAEMEKRIDLQVSITVLSCAVCACLNDTHFVLFVGVCACAHVHVYITQ